MDCETCIHYSELEPIEEIGVILSGLQRTCGATGKAITGNEPLDCPDYEPVGGAI